MAYCSSADNSICSAMALIKTVAGETLEVARLSTALGTKLGAAGKATSDLSVITLTFDAYVH